MQQKIILLLILILGLFLRLYGINWDSGFHLHPDERMLIMVAERINFFNQLNPNFFNYGSLPIYLLKGLAQSIDIIFNSSLANYNGMLYLGRFLSTIFDLGTIILIYKITQIFCDYCKHSKGLNKNQPRLYGFLHIFPLPLLSSFFYAIAFFPIQNSHFFVSDVFLNFFTTLLIFIILKSLELAKLDLKTRQIKIKNQILNSVFFGFCLALLTSTKFTGIVFYPFVILIFLIFIFKFFNNKLRIKFINFLFLIIIFHFSFLIFNFLFMPYAFLDYKRFLFDILTQTKMSSDPYIFPYTLQYVGSTPYLYYLKNIFLWGVGPIISFFSFIGLILFINEIINIKNQKHKQKTKKYFYIINIYFLFFLFYIFYFIIIGRSAVKFMRYMLPIYPFLSIMAGYGVYQIQNSKFKIQNDNAKFKIFNFKLLTLLLIISSIIWTLLFVNIYSQKNTRISATEWILKNIPSGSTLAVEHWDDRIPIFGGEKYNYVEMSLYELPDDEKKWEVLNQRLKQADYIIIASNRLYVPLQRLSDCQKYKVCYPKTAEYYNKLFNGQLGFKKVAEFAVYPKFSIFSFEFLINDQSADESFTVYDHPKVIIFKKFKT